MTEDNVHSLVLVQPLSLLPLLIPVLHMATSSFLLSLSQVTVAQVRPAAGARQKSSVLSSSIRTNTFFSSGQSPVSFSFPLIVTSATSFLPCFLPNRFGINEPPSQMGPASLFWPLSIPGTCVMYCLRACLYHLDI
ncbi:hypothetical protein BDP55DRAFT_665766, partial [Colletotrichum godetiae]